MRRPEFIVSRDGRNATMVWPDGWARELTQALVTAAKALPAPVTNVTVNDEPAPQEVTFDRDPQGRIKSALIEPVE